MPYFASFRQMMFGRLTLSPEELFIFKVMLQELVLESSVPQFGIGNRAAGGKTKRESCRQVRVYKEANPHQCSGAQVF